MSDQDPAGMGAFFANKPTQLGSREAVRALLKQNLDLLRQRREACSIPFPDLAGTSARELRKAYNVYAMQFGYCQGLLNMAYSLGYVDDLAYHIYVDEARSVLLPTVHTVGGR